MGVGFFTQFNEELKVRRQLEQRSRATGRGGRLTSSEAGTATAPMERRLGAEERGLAAGVERRERLKDIGVRGERFEAGTGLRKEGLALEEKRAAGRLAIGKGELGLAKERLETSKAMAPYAIGLGAVDVGVSWRQRVQQRKRDRRWREKLGDILTRYDPNADPAAWGSYHD